jgi:hypothetical protein
MLIVIRDYICLDFKNNEKESLVCLWNNEESGELESVTYLMQTILVYLLRCFINTKV